MKFLQILIVITVIMLTSCKSTSQTDQVPSDTIRPPYAWNQFSMGADLSYVNEIQDYDGVYKDSGNVTDPFKIFKVHGGNTIRVRLWNNPAWVGELTGGKLYSDLFDVEKTIRRAKDAGLAVSLDLHYSDTWADPDHQVTPAAWTGLPLATLGDSVYNFTFRVLKYLESKDLTPEMIQVGNETNPGILFPAGQITSNNYVPFGTLLNSGIKAVRDFSKTSAIKPKIILHVAQMQHAEWWIDGIINRGKVTDFDILGISHYAKWSTVSKMSSITAVISDIRSRYHRQVMVVETAYPWTGDDADSYKNIIGIGDSVAGYQVTKEGQLKYLKDLTQAIISGGGAGLHYWEPAWITSKMKDKWGTGSAWDNCTLFDFQGNALPALGFMMEKYNFNR